MTFDGSHHYTFNGRNEIVAIDTSAATYVYNEDGSRARKTVSSTSTEYVYFGGNQIAELSSGAWTNYVFAMGKRFLRHDSNSSVHYYLQDALGSSRTVTDPTGATIECDSDFYPYGGERAYVTCGLNHYKFTGKEHDSESGLDYFGARNYSSNIGRFISSDWSATPDPVPYANLEYPQTLNLYGYTGNNPLSRTDPDGHFWEELKNFMKWGHWVNNSGLEAALQQEADRDRQQIADLKNLFINGQSPADALKGLNNQQTIALKRSVLDFLLQQVMNSPGTMVSLALVTEGAGSLDAAASAAVAEGRASSWIIKTGRSALATDITTNVSAQEFGANLEASGYAKSLAKDGVTTLYSKGNEVYSIYPRASSTGGPTANLNVGGQIVTKIRLQP